MDTDSNQFDTIWDHKLVAALNKIELIVDPLFKDDQHKTFMQLLKSGIRNVTQHTVTPAILKSLKVAVITLIDGLSGLNNLENEFNLAIDGARKRKTSLVNSADTHDIISETTFKDEREILGMKIQKLELLLANTQSKK